MGMEEEQPESWHTGQFKLDGYVWILLPFFFFF